LLNVFEVLPVTAPSATRYSFDRIPFSPAKFGLLRDIVAGTLHGRRPIKSASPQE